MSTVWSKAYHKQLAGSDIFATQDEIVNAIVDELAGLNNSAISKDIVQKAKTRGTENLSAYECVSFVRGTFYVSYQADDFSKIVSLDGEQDLLLHKADKFNSLDELKNFFHL